MKKFGNTLMLIGAILIIGPLFGFTVRGAQSLGYGQGFLFGAIAIVLGFVLSALTER